MSTARQAGRLAARARAAGALLATVVAVSALTGGTPLAASELPGDPSGGDAADVRASSQVIQRPRGSGTNPGRATSTHFWASSTAQRGYFLANERHQGSLRGFERLVAVDLATGEQAGHAELSPRAYGNPPGNLYTAQGADNVVAVDEEGGRVFVATQAPTVEVNGEQLQGAGPSRAAAASRGELCARPGGTTPLYGCVNGVTILDARSLDQLAHMTLRGLSAEAPLAAPQLLAMSYVAPRGDVGAKLLMLVEDTAHAAEFDAQPRASTRAQSAAMVALVQFDVASASQEWTLRLDQCRGAMASNRSKPYEALKSHRYPAAVLAGGPPERPSVYVACHMVAQSLQGAVLQVPLSPSGTPAALPVGPGEAGGVPGLPAAPADGTAAAATQEHPGRRILVPGPDKVHEMIADPASGRIAMQVLDGEPAAQVWWVFDSALMRFVGTVGIGGPVAPGASMSALDNGRLYVLAKPETAGGRTFAGGLFVADIARTPVSQALVYPDMAERFPADYGNSTGSARWALTVQRLDGGARRLWFPSSWNIDHVRSYVAIEDHRPDPRQPAPEDYAGRTLDLDEADGVTDTSLDGAARGYGARILLVGGAESLSRAGPADPVGGVEQCNDDDWGEENNAIANTIGPLIGGETSGGPCHVAGVQLTSPCLHGDREIVLAAVGPDGPAVVDDAGARGAANPITVDSLTGADLEAPVSRCAGQDWSQVWTAALFGRPPADEPKVSTDLGELVAECVSGGQRTSGQSGDPVVNGYSAAVSCQEDEASGHAYARGTTVDGASVAEALSSFRIYRDPGRGIVARVESVARGISLDGVLRIDTVRGTAESWANGRRQPVERAQRPEGYDPNCDLERTAGTCFTRHLFGVRSPAYSCGPCGDEHALLEGLNAGLGPMGLLFQLREPDARLRQGAENGFTAAIQKPEADRFGDLVLNNDLLQTVLPTLEVIRNAAPNRVLSRKGSKGRQIYQFAGVEVSSSYGIACLHVYDPETGVCAPQAQPPGAIRVALQDTGGTPLAGGAFELRRDADADGVLGLADELLPDGACATAADGVGSCDFPALPPGDYLVVQTAAPDGHAKAADPHPVALAAGEARTITFTNASDVSTVEVSATDDAGAPLEGAAFAAYADEDSDGEVDPGAEPAATCVTGPDGSCAMRLPAGSYVLVQTAAPGGLAPMEPVAFRFASGGQVAAVTVRNVVPAAPAPPAPAAAPAYSAPVAAPPPLETITDAEPPALTGPPAPSLPEAVGGTVVRVIRAPGDAVRLLAREPRAAVAWVASVGLLCLAALSVRRRHRGLALIDQKGASAP